jgi:hypothetical protein
MSGTDTADAAALRAAADVIRRRFGGLATVLAVLDAKAGALDADDDADAS